MSLLQTSLIPRLRITTTSFNPRHRRNAVAKPFPPLTLSLKPDPTEPEPSHAKPKPKRRPAKPKPSQSDAGKKSPPAEFPEMIPRKPRRGRRSEAQAVEDHVRATLGRTLASIREENPEMFENVPNIFRERKLDEDDDDDDDDDDDGGARVESEMVMEEESQDWPLDTDVGWGIRASEYFEKHPIKNVVGEDGFEIDWEGEIDDSWVQEINCLEWESFAYHPSPLVVLVFERYKSSAENWKTLKELEKALKVYWEAKDRLPPRSVKLDINIEKDLAYALKVKEGPQILFLRGHTILYREKEFRTADQLVHLIAHFYYNAKCPSWIDKSALSKRY